MSDAPFQLLRPLTDEEYRGLKDSIRARGVVNPIIADEEGNILDGHHRERACSELSAEGVSLPACPRKVLPGLSDEAKRAVVLSLNLHRRHLTTGDKRTLTEVALKATPEQSDRQIAEMVGVSPTTVGVKRREMENEGQLSKLDTSTGKDGKTRKRLPPVNRRIKPEDVAGEPPVKLNSSRSYCPPLDGKPRETGPYARLGYVEKAVMVGIPREPERVAQSLILNFGREVAAGICADLARLLADSPAPAGAPA